MNIVQIYKNISVLKSIQFYITQVSVRNHKTILSELRKQLMAEKSVNSFSYMLKDKYTLLVNVSIDPYRYTILWNIKKEEYKIIRK